MKRSRQQLVWAIVACAAVVAQLAPKALCHACDQPCCSGQASGHGPHAIDSGAAPAGHCPLCAATADLRLGESDEQPCRCQLNARTDQPTSLSRGTPAPRADGESAPGGPAVVPAVVPQALGVSREYVAASLAVPIRPPRILFGVWRN